MGTDPDGDYVEYVSARLPSLQHSAYLLCGGDRHTADDIVQATIEALYVHWNRARRADNLDAYVQRMLARKFVDSKRRGWAARVRLMWPAPEPAPPPDDPDRADDRDAVLHALRRLPPGQRAVLVLRYLCDQSIEDTARALGCSTGTVKSQTARALAAVRPLLEPALTRDLGGKS
ncbi:SigE family RNA polymerase sigma factor [Virgisporangium aurantiacum]|uniref:RNA polymerase sigma24 factor n=1 Tax=Virgisporangium aurantiacum TaxID=175570 RepID=A0A8J3YZX2_9ACTN|nr:SigE family RNA polymerase sigma factor [Virgisporangium aurantiacum]GIJ52785.1 RNA polymerase sigma24 factor [Virgisporangium aurantiacum]